MKMEIKTKTFKNKLMRFNKLAQITVIEFSLLALLFSGIFFYFTISQQPTTNSFNSYNLDTYLSSISKLDSIRNVVVLEDLSNTTITQNWTNTLTIINLTLNKYELYLTNGTTSKYIQTCTSINGKFFSQSFISSYNLTTFDPKTLVLGVCY